MPRARATAGEVIRTLPPAAVEAHRRELYEKFNLSFSFEGHQACAHDWLHALYKNGAAAPFWNAAREACAEDGMSLAFADRFAPEGHLASTPGQPGDSESTPHATGTLDQSESRDVPITPEATRHVEEPGLPGHSESVPRVTAGLESLQPVRVTSEDVADEIPQHNISATMDDDFSERFSSSEYDSFDDRFLSSPEVDSEYCEEAPAKSLVVSLYFQIVRKVSLPDTPSNLDLRVILLSTPQVEVHPEWLRRLKASALGKFVETPFCELANELAPPDWGAELKPWGDVVAMQDFAALETNKVDKLGKLISVELQLQTRTSDLERPTIVQTGFLGLLAKFIIKNKSVPATISTLIFAIYKSITNGFNQDLVFDAARSGQVLREACQVSGLKTTSDIQVALDKGIGIQISTWAAQTPLLFLGAAIAGLYDTTGRLCNASADIKAVTMIPAKALKDALEATD